MVEHSCNICGEYRTEKTSNYKRHLGRCQGRSTNSIKGRSMKLHRHEKTDAPIQNENAVVHDENCSESSEETETTTAMNSRNLHTTEIKATAETSINGIKRPLEHELRSYSRFLANKQAALDNKMLVDTLDHRDSSMRDSITRGGRQKMGVMPEIERLEESGLYSGPSGGSVNEKLLLTRLTETEARMSHLESKLNLITEVLKQSAYQQHCIGSMVLAQTSKLRQD